MTRFIVSITCLAALSAASPASAQIYSWRDANGAQVYSDRPRPGSMPLGRRPTDVARRGSEDVVTYAVAGRPGVRATKPALPRLAARFDDIIDRQAADSGLSPELIRAVIQVESGFNPTAVSPKGAQGLMQLMPATARELGVVDPFHPEENIRGGVAYLKQLLGRYSQDLRLALAAYNAGPGSVDRYSDVPPYRETQAYVKKITASAPVSPAATLARPRALQIYKWTEMVDGHPIPRYSNVPPAGQQAEVVGRR